MYYNKKVECLDSSLTAILVDTYYPDNVYNLDIYYEKRVWH